MFAESAGVGSTGRRSPPRRARPDLISTTHPASTSAIVGCPSPIRAAATETHADSSPAIAGLVPSIGSTTRTHSGWPLGLDQPAVLGVERDARGMLGQVLLQERLGRLVDREGDVAAFPGAGVGAPGVRAQARQDLLAERQRKVAREPERVSPGSRSAGVELAPRRA